MQLLEAKIENYHVSILHDGDDRPCYLEVKIDIPGRLYMELIKDYFANPKLLSAALACELGLYPSREFLINHGVDPKSQLADLNHSGLYA